jgi:vitamin B12 transporter
MAGCSVRHALLRTNVFQVLHGPPDQELNGKQVRAFSEAAMPVLPRNGKQAQGVSHRHWAFGLGRRHTTSGSAFSASPAQLASPDTGLDHMKRQCHGVVATSAVMDLSRPSLQDLPGAAKRNPPGGGDAAGQGRKHNMIIRLSAAALTVASAFPAMALAAGTEQPTVTVTATRQAQRADEAIADTTVIDRESIERAGPSFSLPELLARQPGIQMSSNGGPGKATDISIRGTNSKHTLFLVDGMRLGSATLGTAAWQDIPLSQIERIEIVRGPASALYGADAIGGVIQVITKKGSGEPKINAFVGAGSYGTREVSAGVAGGTDSCPIRPAAAIPRPRASAPRTASCPPTTPTTTCTATATSRATSPGACRRPRAGRLVLYAESRSMYDSGRSYNNYNNARPERLEPLQPQPPHRHLDQHRALRPVHRRLRELCVLRPTGATIKTTQNQFMWQHDMRLPIGSLLAAYENLHQKATNEGTFDVSRSVNSALLGWTAGIGTHKLQLNARHDDNSQYGGKTTGYAGYGYQILPTLRVQGSVGSAFRRPPSTSSTTPASATRPEGRKRLQQGSRPAVGAGRAQPERHLFRNRISNLIANDQNFIRRTWPTPARGHQPGLRRPAGRLRPDRQPRLPRPEGPDTGKRLQRRANKTGNLASAQLRRPHRGRRMAGCRRPLRPRRDTKPLGGYGC